jgi:hypothetical protein
MIAANDNTPRQAADMTLAQRRAWLATLPATAKPVLAWPTAERLSRLDNSAAVHALLKWAELDRPASTIAANDNNEPCTDPMDTEARHETRPSVGEIMAAADDDLVLTFESREQVNAGWSIMTADGRPMGFIGEVVILGRLRFIRGAMMSWGTTVRGKLLKPVERRRMPRGKATPARSISNVRELVKTTAPIANGSGWLGGITRPRGNSSRPDIGDAEAEIEMLRNARRDAVRLALGPVHSRVLDLAITDASAREIGEALGYVGKTAERKAVRMINGAIEELQKVAA